jgi:hypothetical protein
MDYSQHRLGLVCLVLGQLQGRNTPRSTRILRLYSADTCNKILHLLLSVLCPEWWRQIVGDHARWIYCNAHIVVKNSLRLSTFVIRDEANVWTLNVLTPSYPEFGTSAHDTLIRASTLPPKKLTTLHWSLPRARRMWTTSKLHWNLPRFVDSLGLQVMSICILPSPKVWSCSLTRKLGLVSSFPPFRRDRACGKKDE